ncbi:MAG: RDD family protein [Selenomonadaceae bacterium]|jgi:uncharacterized RDD family membrane protein YckC
MRGLHYKHKRKKEKECYTKTRAQDRIVAYLIDLVIAGLPLLLYLMVYGTGDGTETSLAANAFLIWGLLYLTTKDAFGGRSFGKRYIGLIVLQRNDNAPCSIIKSVIRNLLVQIPLEVLLLFSGDGRRMGDTVTNTQVVRMDEYIKLA